MGKLWTPIHRVKQYQLVTIIPYPMWLQQAPQSRFSETRNAFSKVRQRIIRQYCVLSRRASSARHRDVAYERCLKKAVITIFPKE